MLYYTFHALVTVQYYINPFYRALERISVPTSEFKDGEDPFDTETDEEREMRLVLLYIYYLYSILVIIMTFLLIFLCVYVVVVGARLKRRRMCIKTVSSS